MINRTAQLKDLTRAACSDDTLRATLQRAADHFQGIRQRTMAAGELPPERLEAARRVRQRTLRELPDLLRRLEESVTANGGTVHWARDAAEARSIISGLVAEHGVRSVVKGKSMITEEIALNDMLESLGVEAVETDLGEYIVQLSGEGPSHIIAPAVHKSRAQIADLFRVHLGSTCREAEELTRVARRALREKFLAADMGVTGANMAVAETGTVVLVENEGNIRMSTTCPPIHVSVMSIEKVVATLDDAAAVLQVLPRAATGQKLSTYTNFISGPRRDGEADGAREFHLVILDNGRSRILADPALRDMLRCIRCGACLNACPVYQSVGGHAYGWVYSGPIGALLTTMLSEPGQAADLVFATTLCGTCAEVCPVGVDHPRMFMELRRKTIMEPEWNRQGDQASGLFARAHSLAAANPLLYRAGSRALRALDPKLKLAAKLPGLARLRRFTQTRALPGLRSPFSKRWPELAQQLRATKEDGHE